MVHSIRNPLKIAGVVLLWGGTIHWVKVNFRFPIVYDISSITWVCLGEKLALNWTPHIKWIGQTWTTFYFLYTSTPDMKLIKQFTGLLNLKVTFPLHSSLSPSLVYTYAYWYHHQLFHLHSVNSKSMANTPSEFLFPPKEATLTSKSTKVHNFIKRWFAYFYVSVSLYSLYLV